MLNYHYSKMYNGKMILRFDDTNPSKENDNFVENIKSDIKTMGIYPERVSYTSDYFDIIQEHMKTMIKKGFCYADNTEHEEMKRQRDEGIESTHRLNTEEFNLEKFEQMIVGDDKAKGWCIRAKMNMQNLVKCLRDPVLYRSNESKHH